MVMRIMAALRLARGFVVGAGVSGVIVSTTGSSAQMVSAAETTHSVRRALERLPYYGVFDYMSFGIDRGTVTLTGYTYNGSLRSAAEIAAKRSSGVDEVANRLEVLPASQEDDRIRWVTFYKIYTDAFLSRYASGGEAGVRREIYEARRFPGMYQPLGFYSIHIVVRHGQTTLYGVVDSAGDRHIAEVRAREVFGVFSVENEIVVAKKAAKR
jgi:hyperosmotically inducible periplasmic protein